MEVSKLDINGLALLLKKVYLPMMEHLARNENNQEWLDTLSDFEQLLDQFLMLGGGQDLTKLENPLSNKINKTFPTNFPSLRDEYVFWQKQMIELSRQQQWMVQNWGEATIETDSTLRQVHYTLKLFRLVRDPIQVFTEKNTMKEIDFYVKSLASSLKAVILQPSSKSGIHSNRQIY
ncbi:Dynein heavy chain 10, axonemal [Daphnia magna]|uniref:Dynein heavy chain 10, axonemal n=1 Tax=Daphnia magna TaxID=35525 RepID=A0A164ZP86_9CRUS|nr:Dynein heavy chain 10, axonemal [Daphnia magna]